VTGLRVLLVPILVILILDRTRAASYAAAAVFVAGALSDGLDGYLARRHHMATRTGAWLDPLSDKLLVAAPIITMTAVGRFPVWGAVVILAREAAVTGLRVVRGTRGTSMPATEIAKVKTASQVLAVTLYLLPLSSDANPVRVAVLAVGVAITLYSGVDYFVRAVRPSAMP
jgi:CDP-diacylglycerol---glycerol-3-phosphate 3-phosphatidyltransferase